MFQLFDTCICMNSFNAYITIYLLTNQCVFSILICHHNLIKDGVEQRYEKLFHFAERHTGFILREFPKLICVNDVNT